MTKSSRGVLSSVQRSCARQVCSPPSSLSGTPQKQCVSDRMNMIALRSLDSAQQRSIEVIRPQTMICARCLVY